MVSKRGNLLVNHEPPKPNQHFNELASRIKNWGRELGFDAVGISGTELSNEETRLLGWLDAGYHGEMDYMERHGVRRSRPANLVPGTIRVISVRMNYWTGQPAQAKSVLDGNDSGYVARYALGRDYHKIIRRRLQKLADRIHDEIGEFGYRAFTDSAPVMEKPLARNAGLGWVGKHTNLLNRESGSWFFIGELYTDLPLPVDAPADEHCGTCSSCIEACPTGAIVAPFKLDARRCISYLTIELKGDIPTEFRASIGNRIFGCDDCQLVCPWNRFADATDEPDYQPRHQLDDTALTELFAWSESEFLAFTAGSAIRRLGYERWLRNIAVGLGNADTSKEIVAALASRKNHPSRMVTEHVRWALKRHTHEQ